ELISANALTCIGVREVSSPDVWKLCVDRCAPLLGPSGVDAVYVTVPALVQPLQEALQAHAPHVRVHTVCRPEPEPGEAVLTNMLVAACMRALHVGATPQAIEIGAVAANALEWASLFMHAETARWIAVQF